MFVDVGLVQYFGHKTLATYTDKHARDENKSERVEEQELKGESESSVVKLFRILHELCWF